MKRISQLLHYNKNITQILLTTILITLAACQSDDSAELSPKKNITTFSILNVKGTIDTTNKTITIELPENTDISSLSPEISISDKASVSPKSGQAQDFTNPIIYTVTAEDKSTQKYTVNVSVKPSALSSEKKILEFSIMEVQGTISESNKTITLELPENTDITALSPKITISKKASITPVSGETIDFTNPMDYIVTAEDGTSQTYVITVTLEENKNIYMFTYNNKTYEVVKEAKTWEEASKFAIDRDGYLAEINNEAENNALFDEASKNAGIDTSNTSAPDGGGASYLWLGGNDIAEEGSWVWNGNNDGNATNFWKGKSATNGGTPIDNLYNNWGNEPDDYNSNQDGLALALTQWPLNSGHLGKASQWNDVNHTNKLYFIIEFDN